MPDFAALAARVSRAVADHLGNADLVFAEGAVRVLLARDESGVPSALGTPQRLMEWQASAPSVDFPSGVAVGSTATAGAFTYQVTRDEVSHDGWRSLTLRRVA